MAQSHKIYDIHFVKFRELAGFVLHHEHTHSGSKHENAWKLRMLNSAWTESQESDFCTLLLSFKCIKKNFIGLTGHLPTLFPSTLPCFF